jgi:hypothetical protein
VDGAGETRIATVRQARVGSVGLAVDPAGRKAYLAEGERVFTVDLRTLAVSDPGPLRTLAKAPLGSERSARWLGNGLYACRDAFLRSVVDLASGRTVRSGFPAGTRRPTLLLGDSRG